MATLLEGLAGAALVIWVLNDVFHSVAVPRPTPGIRPSSIPRTTTSRGSGRSARSLPVRHGDRA